MAARAPSAQNSQPWHWRVSREGVHLHADRSRQLGDADSDRRDVLLSCGAVLDHCVVALAAHGWHTRLRRFPDASDHDHLALIEIIEAPATEPSRELAACDPTPPRRPSPLRCGSDSVRHAGTALYPRRPAPGHAGRGPRHEMGPPGRRRCGAGYGGAAGSADAAHGDDGVLLVLGTDTDDDLMRLRAGETMSRLLLSATALGLVELPADRPTEADAATVWRSHARCSTATGIPKP